MTMTDQDKVSALVAEVQRVAAENFDFVYNADTLTSCWYNPQMGGKGSCLIGKALINLGYDIDEDYEGSNASAVLPGVLGVDHGASGIQYLNNVQSHQDNGATWSEAVLRGMDGEYRTIKVATT